MKRTKLVYLVGKSEKELLAYDEYDAHGSGIWFTDKPMLAEEYNWKRSCEQVIEYKEDKLDVFLWEITYDVDKKEIVKEELWLQFDHDEAIKYYEDHNDK